MKKKEVKLDKNRQDKVETWAYSVGNAINALSDAIYNFAQLKGVKLTKEQALRKAGPIVRSSYGYLLRK